MKIGRSLGKGERFYDTPELVRKWADAIPYTETPQKYVVFKPLHLVGEKELPDLIVFFVNPDQLSVLVILSGYYRGRALNVVAPFSSACQSVLLAYQEIEKEYPNAILGYFDISQRNYLSKELLSFTVPYKMYKELEAGAVDGCMETPVWKKIENRFSAE